MEMQIPIGFCRDMNARSWIKINLKL